MGERRGEEQQDSGNPLVSGRGVTTVKNSVVQRIAGLAAQEVEGVHMGGAAARTASRASGGRTGSQDQTRGVSAVVGRTEVAIDLTMAVDYGSDILRTVNRVRDRISARVEPLTGLRITELNVTVTDVLLPENGDAEEDDTQSLPEAEPTTQRQQTTRQTSRETTGESNRETTRQTSRETTGETTRDTRRETTRETNRQTTGETTRESRRGGQRPADDEEKDQTTELRLDKEDGERRES